MKKFKSYGLSDDVRCARNKVSLNKNFEKNFSVVVVNKIDKPTESH